MHSNSMAKGQQQEQQQPDEESRRHRTCLLHVSLAVIKTVSHPEAGGVDAWEVIMPTKTKMAVTRE